LLFGQLEHMFHPVLSPQLPPSLESLKPVDHLASATVVKIKTDRRKLIIVDKNQNSKYQFNTRLVNEDVVTNNQLFSEQSAVLAETSIPSTEPSNVNLQESGGKFDLSVGDKKPATPVQNIIEFKLRNPENRESTPTTVEFPPSPQLPQVEKIPAGKGRVVEVIADRQEYDEQRRIVTADGNVVVRFDGAVIDADSLQINLDNLIAVGKGNVALTSGNQVLQGKRFTYNFIQDNGELENGKGELYIPTTGTDFTFSPSLPTDITAGGVPSRPLSNRIRANQPVTGVSSPGGIEFGASGQSDVRNVPAQESGGVVKRLRFEAQRIEFYPRGFQAQDVRITNDPFSPPELEIRADKVTVTREAPLIDRIVTQRQRLVFDQKVVVPIPINSRKIDRRPRQVNTTIVSPGFDSGKRGGLYVERSFEPINTDQKRWTITPQFYVQRAFKDSGNVASLFGVKSKLNAVLGPKTVLEGTGELTSFDFDQVEDSLRGSLRLRQILGNVNPYTLSLESSYRDRLYNGSLGYQTVQSSIGGIISSPIIPLGKSGINLSYQGGAQYIDANTDRQDLLSPVRKNDRISLSRLQGSVALSGGINLWQGKPLAATATEGLKYTSNPVVPYLQAIAGITGTTSYYGSSDNQSTLTGTMGLVGQIGNFSRPYLDYTAFNLTYSQGTNSGLSPFLFDRSVDNKVLNAGLSQQLYGPFRLGLQTSINLDTGKATSTDYIMEYSRRTYGISLRYNPVLQLGGFSIRISDFNWTGGTDPFSNGELKPVVGGVVRQDN
jgi:lipopolysaccharide export system protein LptA